MNSKERGYGRYIRHKFRDKNPDWIKWSPNKVERELKKYARNPKNAKDQSRITDDLLGYMLEGTKKSNGILGQSRVLKKARQVATKRIYGVRLQTSDKKQLEKLTPEEEKELENIIEIYQKGVVRKAEKKASNFNKGKANYIEEDPERLFEANRIDGDTAAYYMERDGQPDYEISLKPAYFPSEISSENWQMVQFSIPSFYAKGRLRQIFASKGVSEQEYKVFVYRDGKKYRFDNKSDSDLFVSKVSFKEESEGSYNSISIFQNATSKEILIVYSSGKN